MDSESMLIGIVPLAAFAGSVWFIGQSMLFRRPISESRVFTWVPILTASIIPFFAWFMGYRMAADHEFKKFIILQLLGAVLYAGIIFFLPRTEVGELPIGTKIKGWSSTENLVKAGLAATCFLAICFIFFVSIPFFREPYDCNSSFCRQAKFILGNPKYSFDKIWLFSAFSCSFPFICGLNLLAALKKSPA